MSIFCGAGVALVTPFHEDNTVNYEALERLVEFQIANETDAIIVCGTTGEAATMTEEERIEVISFVVKVVKGRVPVIAGTGCNCTQSAADFSRKVQTLGVNALLVVTPYYNKATQGGLYAHYATIANAVSLPIILYNVPSRTGCNLLPETAVKLAEDFTNIVAIKEASENVSQVTKLAKLGRGKIDIYSGCDDLIVPILSVGGIGVISVLSNIAPKATHDMVMDYLNGNVQKAMEAQLSYYELIKTLFCEVNPIPVKAALNMMGYNAGGLRLPLTALEEVHIAPLKKLMIQLGLVESELF